MGEDHLLVLEHGYQEHVDRLRGVAKERESRIENTALRCWRLRWLLDGRVQHVRITNLIQRDLMDGNKVRHGLN